MSLNPYLSWDAPVVPPCKKHHWARVGGVVMCIRAGCGTVKNKIRRGRGRHRAGRIVR